MLFPGTKKMEYAHSIIFLSLLTTKIAVQNTWHNYQKNLSKGGEKKANWLETQGVTQWWVPWVVCLFWLLYILAWVLEQSATRKWHWALLKTKQPIKPSPTKSLYSPANDHEEGSSARWYPFDYCHPTLGKCHKRTHTFLPPHQVLRGCKTKPCWPCPPGTNKAEVTPLPYPPGPGDCGEEPQPALTE